MANESDEEPTPVTVAGATVFLGDQGAAGEHAPGSTHVTGFRIVRKLGEGGMGIVYEAEEESPRRRVALKVVRGGPLADERLVRTFLREIQALALLKHAGIAALYETGRTDYGQPFFVMELVEGEPLDTFLASHPLPEAPSRRDLHPRLAIFHRICEAIHYAHQRGVIHRDLKPSNIQVCVSPDGRGAADSAARTIKILDFGIARLTEDDPRTAMTEAGRIQGTLAYMSPEQARGRPEEIDLRTDVYSLGVILYQLLTGRLPLEGSRSVPETLRDICEAEPPRPGSLQRAFRGDLETIVLKALEKEPPRRYQSVLALDDDIGRFLTDQPILARSPSAGYQIRKLMARHKGAVASLATLLVLLAAFAVTMSVMFQVQLRERRRADAERARAVLETKKAEQINAFLQNMLSSADPDETRGREVTVREVLDRAAERIDTELAGEPEVRAEVQSTIGNTYRALGLYDEAEPHLDEALSLHRSAPEPQDAKIAARMSDLASLYWERGDYVKAEPVFREVLARNRAAFGDTNAVTATSVNNLGLVLKSEGRYPAAESLLRSSLLVRRRLLSPRDPELAVSLSNLGSVLQAQGRSAPAESVYREALTIRRGLLGEDHPEVVASMQNLALTLLAENRFAESESLLAAAFRTGRGVYDDRHPLLAVIESNLALVFSRTERPTEAEAAYRDALARFEELSLADHPAYASSLNNLARLLQREERYPEAEALFRRALDVTRTNLGSRHPEVATQCQNLALVLQDQGKLAPAEPLLREALRLRREVLGDAHPRVGSSLVGLGTLLLDRGNFRGAEPLLREGARILKASEPTGWAAAYAENSLGCSLARQGKYAEAETLLTRSLPVLLSSPATPEKRRREARERLIDLFAKTGRPERAAALRGS